MTPLAVLTALGLVGLIALGLGLLAIAIAIPIAWHNADRRHHEELAKPFRDRSNFVVVVRFYAAVLVCIILAIAIALGIHWLDSIKLTHDSPTHIKQQAHHTLHLYRQEQRHITHQLLHSLYGK